jgi:hypothetical protein
MDGSVDSPDENPQVRMVRTENGGKTWSPLQFDREHFHLNHGESPGRLWFVDAKHGWFGWRVQSGSAFSRGLLFSTSDGGRIWKELPVPPSGGDFRFYTKRDGWLVGGASNQDLYVTRDGGNTWREVSVPEPINCKPCRPIYEAIKFRNANSGVLAVTFLDPLMSRSVLSTYVTHNRGNSWQSVDAYEQSDSTFSNVSPLNAHVIRVFPPLRTSWLQIRNGLKTINASVPEGLSPHGRLVGTSFSSFADDSDGWLIYGVDNVCTKSQTPETDGPPSPCSDPITQLDLLATRDGGRTFKIITPHLSAVSSK